MNHIVADSWFKEKYKLWNKNKQNVIRTGRYEKEKTIRNLEIKKYGDWYRTKIKKN